MNATIIEQLVAHLVPGRLAACEENREQRNWVVRFANELPSTWNAADASTVLTTDAATAVADTRRVIGLAVDDGGLHAPVVRLIPADARHVVLNITTIKLEADDANEYLVAASTALRALDELFAIDDIQGIPRRFWRVVIGP